MTDTEVSVKDLKPYTRTDSSVPYSIIDESTPAVIKYQKAFEPGLRLQCDFINCNSGFKAIGQCTGSFCYGNFGIGACGRNFCMYHDGKHLVKKSICIMKVNCD